MMICIENLKVSTQKLLELINEFSKVVGYKIDIKKTYMVIMKYQKDKVKKKILFKTASSFPQQTNSLITQD